MNKNHKALLIIFSTVILTTLVVGGIFFYINSQKLDSNNTNNNSNQAQTTEKSDSEATQPKENKNEGNTTALTTNDSSKDSKPEETKPEQSPNPDNKPQNVDTKPIAIPIEQPTILPVQPTPTPEPTTPQEQAKPDYKGAFVKAVSSGEPGYTGVNVRNVPCGETVLDTARWFDYGTITNNAVNKECKGKNYEWLEIQWESGITGWSIKDNLQIVYAKPSYNPIILTGDCDWGTYFYNPATRDNPVCAIVDSITKKQLQTFNPTTLYGIYSPGIKLSGKQYVYVTSGDAFTVAVGIYEYIYETNSLIKITSYAHTGIPSTKYDSSGNPVVCESGKYTLDCFDTKELNPQELEQFKKDINQSNAEYFRLRAAMLRYAGKNIFE